jgi:serine/threonine-protein kinase
MPATTPPNPSADIPKTAEEEAKAKKEAEERLATAQQNVPEDQSPEVTPSSEDVNAQYFALITSGKEKMVQKKYTEAKMDFGKASELKTTEEVSQLYLECSEKEEEQKVAERKVLYEIKMPLGNYMVVRKISTQRYGVIDAKGNEYIECIYVNTGISSNGRAFERKDGKYDIYNTEGEQIAKGVADY